MSRTSAAALMGAIDNTSPSKAKNENELFIYSSMGLESLAEKLSQRFHVNQRGPLTVSFETMQQQEADMAEKHESTTAVYREQLNAARAAGAPEEMLQSNQRVFVLSDPNNDEERRALAAISTSLVTSAINDPDHTVAAFLPIGTSVHGEPNTNRDPQPQMSVIRSLIQRLGVICFESISDLESHLLPA